MSDTEQVATQPGEYLRRHVLDPFETAESILDREHREVEAERCAFEQFRGRIAGVETVSGISTVPATRSPLHKNRPRPTERVRSAYYETVMSVDHYDEFYDEPLIENAAAELSDEVAAGFRLDTHLQFTDLYKRTLVTAINNAIDQRETFCAILDDERESLNQSRATLHTVVDELDGTHVPACLGNDFTNILDNVARQRQETFDRRTMSSRTDGRELCSYLYADCGWTYPVLTAVTRLRGAVNGMVN